MRAKCALCGRLLCSHKTTGCGQLTQILYISLRVIIDKEKKFRECVHTQIKRAYEMHIGTTAGILMSVESASMLISTTQRAMHIV